MKSLNKQADLISELSNSVQFLGVEATIGALKKAREDKFYDDHTCTVITTVCETLELPIENFNNNKHTRSDKGLLAVCFVTYFLFEDFKFSYMDITKKLNINKTTIWDSMRTIRSAKLKNPKSNIDIIIATHFSKLKELITEYKKNHHE